MFKTSNNLESSNALLLYCVENLIALISQKDINFYVDHIVDNSIDILSFDFDNTFYWRLLNDLESNYFSKQNIIQDYLNDLPKITVRNMLIYLNYLKNILISKKDETVDNLFKDKRIKLDIAIIFGYFINKLNEKIIMLPEYFPLCIRELENKYNLLCNIKVTNLDEKWKNEAKDILENLVKKKKNNIMFAFRTLLTKYCNSNNFKDYDDILAVKNKFENDLNNMNIQDLEKNYVKDSQYIKKYIDIRLIENNISNQDEEYNSKKNLFNNYLFYTEILNINLDNIENAINLLDFYYNNKKFKDELDIVNEFQNYQNKINSVLDEDKTDHSDIFKSILDSKEFNEKLISILNSNSIKTYLENKRVFTTGQFNVKIVKDYDDYDDNLRDGYVYLMNHLEKDIFFLKKLIIFKYLPKNIRVYVNPYMRIALNPLFIDISDSLKENEIIKKEIITSYLIIILIHETIHFKK